MRYRLNTFLRSLFSPVKRILRLLTALAINETLNIDKSIGRCLYDLLDSESVPVVIFGVLDK